MHMHIQQSAHKDSDTCNCDDNQVQLGNIRLWAHVDCVDGSNEFSFRTDPVTVSFGIVPEAWNVSFEQVACAYIHASICTYMPNVSFEQVACVYTYAHT